MGERGELGQGDRRKKAEWKVEKGGRKVKEDVDEGRKIKTERKVYKIIESEGKV